MFSVTTPFFFTKLTQYTDALALTLAMERAGQIGRAQMGWLDYAVSQTPTWEAPWVGTSLSADLGWIALVGAAGGILLAGTGRLGLGGAVYAVTTVGYFVGVSRPGWIKALRFLLPMVPFLAVLSGAFLERCVPLRLRRDARVWIVAALLVAWVPGRQVLRYVMALGEPSTNVSAREWMTTHVPPGSVVFVGPFYTDDLHHLPFRFQWLRDVGPRQYGLPPGRGPSPERNPIYGPELVDGLRRAGVQYVVLNSYFDGSLARVPENERFFPRSVASYAAFRSRLAGEADLIQSIVGWDAGRLGPDIEVWRLRADLLTGGGSS